MGTIDRKYEAIQASGIRPVIRNELLVPVWSKQHGAYITIISSWLTALFLSERFSILQLLILIFLLAGFNYSELLIDGLRRKTDQDNRKKVWGFIYLFIAVLTGIPLIETVPSSKVIVPFLILSGFVMMLAHFLKHHKSIVSEIVTFSAFSLGGLLAWNPVTEPEWDQLFRIWTLMASFYCLSIFLVKSRLHKINNGLLILYTLPVTVLLLVFYQMQPAAIAVSGLIVLRALPLLLAPSWYRSIKLKYIGFSEIGFQLVFILALTQLL